jgi:Transposase zinc-binding domain
MEPSQSAPGHRTLPHRGTGGNIMTSVRAAGYRALSFNSCRNRHCPKCQTGARDRWIATRQSELLPVLYIYVVFTVPHHLAHLALVNKKVVPRHRRDSARGRRRPQTSRCTHRCLCRAAQNSTYKLCPNTLGPTLLFHSHRRRILESAKQNPLAFPRPPQTTAASSNSLYPKFPAGTHSCTHRLHGADPFCDRALGFYVNYGHSLVSK